MIKYKTLNVSGALLDEEQLGIYLEKIAADQIIKTNSDINTFPVPRVKENLKFIYEVYKFLGEDIKNGIPIHPAGEWILDNFYIIEKNAKIIIKNLTKKKYRKLVGIANGVNKGFSRVFILANDIVAYTDGKINAENLEHFLLSYQKNKTLSMEELWNISLFLQISLIEKIRNICEKIYLSQIQKRKVANIIDRLIDFKSNTIFKAPKKYRFNLKEKVESKYPFIEYMSYRLKKYGKRAYSYLEVFENQIQKLGSSINECVNKEHYDIAAKKISMGNSIISINTLSRINFIEIFNRTNGVEDILRNDPAGVYSCMDYKTKEHYRLEIEKIAHRLKISEIYIARKCLELSEKNNNKDEKKSHVGYYLIDEGKSDLYRELNNKTREKNYLKNAEKYINSIGILTVFLCAFIASKINFIIENFIISFILFLILIVPIKNIVIKLIQYISGQLVKPKIIPKMDFYNGIPESYTTMVIIPTILGNKDKVNEMIKKMEVYYLANKSKNIYFTLLGDCTESNNINESFDNDIIECGLKSCDSLNKKYKNDIFPIFNFLYRKRTWSTSEQKYIGWERKRGLIEQFNSYLLYEKNKDEYLINTLENWKIKNKNIPKIKYIITLDADTNLVLNSGLELVGTMAHILNKPQFDKNNNIISKGYALIQPRVGIDLQESSKSTFTKLFSGMGGTDSYTNAVSDFYFDNFGEGIYTGKGIYDLELFDNVIKNEIPENIVLSHDLLEGSYARCGLATDIMVMDGYPGNYISYRKRAHRWIRGDWQIWSWIIKNKLNVLSKFKIIDNLYRSLNDIFIFVLLLFNIFFNIEILGFIIALNVTIPFFIEILNKIIHKKNGKITQKKFAKEISGISLCFIRLFIDILLIPDKAVLAINAMCKSIYRMTITKRHLLEWTTSEDSEKKVKNNLFTYFKEMIFSFIFGVLFLIFGVINNSVINSILGLIWIAAPVVMNIISKPIIVDKKINELNSEEQDYIKNIGKKTWIFFKDNLNEKSNYLPPDNYQENRKQKIAYRTSPTNIGLALLSVVSSYDLKYENKENTINLLIKMLDSIEKLPKWNGHLYNWYNIEDLTPLIPRYISSVDSGNFVGYLYVLKQFFINENDENIEKNNLIERVDKIINETNFSKLFDDKSGLFSIGFNIEENKMTDSYYDLLASEARQASIVAIAKKDITSKHWKNLSRTLTVLNGYKGLISWSGTAFEYLMPTINIRRYENSLLDESCKFMIMSQIEYAKKLGITWGISEAAFNIKDLNGNYQYKAFGIPWLGLKRGLAEEMVVSSYGTVLAINDVPKLVIKNIKQLEKCGMIDKYGLYESIDYTPGRVNFDKQYSVVKTYMAHHQGLILLSINNLINNNILQDRFSSNPEIAAVDILLQERMPNNVIIAKEKKERIEKIKYVEYNYYYEHVFDEKNNTINEYNLISNNGYSVLIDKDGNGYSKYKNEVINRFKPTDDTDEGIQFFIKDADKNKVWSPTKKYTDEKNEYKVIFSPDKVEYLNNMDGIKTKLSVIVAPDDPVELRILKISNMNTKTKVEISCLLEPIISNIMQDYAHKAFNNLFVSFELIDNVIIARRKCRNDNEKDLYLGITLHTNNSNINNLEYEIDKNYVLGRNIFGVPELIKNSQNFRSNICGTTNPFIALRRKIDLGENCSENISCIISVGNDKDLIIQNINKYKNYDNIERAVKLSRAQTEAKNQYLGIDGEDAYLYQKILTRLFIKCGKNNEKIDKKIKYNTEELWKFGISGDNPIILLCIRELSELDILKKLVKAFEYFKIQGMNVDLVIINNEQESYENFLRVAINEIIWDHQSQNESGNIFILNNISKQDMELLKVRANLIFKGKDGKIELQLEELDFEYKKLIDGVKLCKNEFSVKNNNSEIIKNWKLNFENIKFYNEYGGFIQDGNEYVININSGKKLPTVWSNVIANKNFGTVVTENMGGYTWYKNSRLNRITAWNNDPVTDIPSETIYFYDKENQNIWTTSIGPIEDKNEYYIFYGKGYATYKHYCNNIEQTIDVFVPQNDAVKINIVKLKNVANEKRNIRLVYYIKPVLDEDEIKSNGYINLEFFRNENYLEAQNIINSKFNQIMYVSSSEDIKSYTGIKKELFDNGNLANPEGVKATRFSGINSLYKDGIIAVDIDIQMGALEEKELSVFYGIVENDADISEMQQKYSNIDECHVELENVKKYWENLTNKVKINTPDESINTISNGWLIYQVLSSRLYAKSGFYQSGGAIGFRDQLQDVLCLKYFDLEMVKEQILSHCRHQFLEGDVLHWWHDINGRGIRTRFSDDLLWLPYVVSDYIEFSDDIGFLDIETYYLEGKTLDDGVDECYDKYEQSSIKESVYNHCIRAIEKSLNFGEHEIPKIGSGDWNDGFSTVGNKGIGESVWLGFFLYDILNKFLKYTEIKKDSERATKYSKIIENLKEALNKNCWDGNWYYRAFCDDGTILGSSKNDECKIDSISQSWAIISGAGNKEKVKLAFDSMEKHLVDKQKGIIKLLNPAFDKSNLKPGYIKAYLPGTRENGGQYTHGKCCYDHFYRSSQIIVFWRCCCSFKNMSMCKKHTSMFFEFTRLAKSAILCEQENREIHL